MIQNPGYTLKELAGVPYLLPYGQMIADHRRGIKINDTGAYLWNLLANERTLDEILSTTGDYFHVDSLEYPDFTQEISQFLNILLAQGILLEKNLEAMSSPNAAHTSLDLPVHIQDKKYISIGKLNLRFLNFGEAYPQIPDAFSITTPETIHQTLVFHNQEPADYIKGPWLLNNMELKIIELENTYILIFPQAPQLYEMHLSKDGSLVHIYGKPPYTKQFHEDLFHAIRLPFLYLAGLHGMVALHSASIHYAEKAWLFSGPSGTGKSTHTNLWKEFLNVPVINGDLNLLAFEGDTPVIHGIPWCGTSEIFDTKTYPLGGIILLKQAPSDYIRELTADEKQLMVSQRFISPSWTKKLFEKNLDLAGALADKCLVCRLCCTKEKSAMDTIKEKIDQYLEGN